MSKIISLGRISRVTANTEYGINQDDPEATLKSCTSKTNVTIDCFALPGEARGSSTEDCDAVTYANNACTVHL